MANPIFSVRRLAGALLVAAPLLASVSIATDADAFCGFYVAGADAKLFNNATQVVLMRDGTRTVLSMQNNYQGPPENFAMVVPVPVVLQKENVRTLDPEIFKRLDSLTSPRLVEYWERDPCHVEVDHDEPELVENVPAPADQKADPRGVTVEAAFKVGEYDIVVLGAKDSSGLTTWLKDNEYKIPDGSEPLLRPYVEQEMKFFVAKVDAKKVQFKDGMAELSPLRFHYDDDKFSLPVRLGLVNSKGTQDLIVHIVAKGRRYEVSNYPNVTIPTNLDVSSDTKERFGPFYAALFDQTLEKSPGAVVTEYAWSAASCDPCPTPALNESELVTLGADVLSAPNPPAETKPSSPAAPTGPAAPIGTAVPSSTAAPQTPMLGRVTIGSVEAPAIVTAKIDAMKPVFEQCFEKAREDDPTLSGKATVKVLVNPGGGVDKTSHTGGDDLPLRMLNCVKSRFDLASFPPAAARSVSLDIPLSFESVPVPPPVHPSEYVVTRLHARYTAETMKEDLIFAEAKPIVGGRENRSGGELERGAKEGSVNNFQARYAIRHAWEGAVDCESPRRGIWEGPNAKQRSSAMQVARDLAFAPRTGLNLAKMLRSDVPELGLKGEAKAPKPSDASDAREAPSSPSGGCGSCDQSKSSSSGGLWFSFLVGAGFIGARLIRRRKAQHHGSRRG